MIKRLINIFRATPTRGGVRIVPRESHNISRKDISRSALRVMGILNDAGFEAYLVGGGVRDLLLGGRPKDFDVATDARPEQIKKLFRSARIIGRRFQIVHVRFGRDIIEVTTFRGHHNGSHSGKQSARSDTGMLLRDNVYGDLKSDALRRDFTVNALYYTTHGFAVHDYTNGMEDLARNKIRMIGDPETRYREDPVRMLRAIRFAAKLGFDIDKTTEKPIHKLGELLAHIPAARLFEEILKLFMAGHAEATFTLLQDYRLLHYLFPETAAQVDESPHTLQLILQAMHNTDRRIHNEQRVTPAFIFAALLWGPLAQRQQQLLSDGEPPARAHQIAAQDVISQQIQRTAIPKRFQQTMREIWELQGRLPKRGGKQAAKTFEHPRFRAAYDFLLLREASGEDLGGLGQWWTDYQNVDSESRQAMVDKIKAPAGKRPRRRRRKPSSTRTQGQPG